MLKRFPDWLKKRMPNEEYMSKMRELLQRYGLNTICESARCPNRGECFARHTATFMILGNICTRRCGFCAVNFGEPLPLDPQEPERIAQAAQELGLKHVVITSVTRDDLEDGGAAQFAETIKKVRTYIPGAIVEILTPDFQGSREALEVVVKAKPDIFNHNVETVPRLYPRARPQADYPRSLELLKRVKEMDKSIYTKSGLMVGLGESEDEVEEVMEDLRRVDCDILTIGQYLRPTLNHLEVVEYLPLESFERYRILGEELGFSFVASGPFVRSSFNAERFFQLLQERGRVI